MDAKSQLELLHNCGLAVYVLSAPPETADLMDALGAGGNFAAVLADGRIVLSDIAKLPEPLRAQATRLDPAETDEAPAASPSFYSNRQSVSDTVALLCKISAQVDRLGHDRLALDQLMERFDAFETKVENLAHRDQWHGRFEEITEKLAQIEISLDQLDPSAVLEEVLPRVKTTAPAAVQLIDMAPIHQAIARQTTAMAQAVRRLEAVAAQVEASRPGTEDSLDRFETLIRDITNQSVPGPVYDGGAIDNLRLALEQQAEELQNVRLTLSHNAEITGNIIAQRQSIARYGTALHNAISRMEAITDRLPMAVLDRPIQADLAETLSSIADRYFAFVSPQSALAAQNTPQQKSDDAVNIAQPAHDKLNEFIDDLRFATAELIAANTQHNQRVG